MAMFTPWMTAANTLKRKPATFERAMFIDCFYTILGTGRRKATACT